MKPGIFVFFLLCFGFQNGNAQNIFSALRLNDSADIANGAAKYLKTEKWAYGSWGIDRVSTLTHLNDHNQEIRHQRFEDGTLTLQVTYHYNDSTGLKEETTLETWHPLIGHQKERNRHFYNEQGFHIRTESYNAVGELTGYTEVTPNTLGYPAKLVNFDQHGNQLGGVEKASYSPETNTYTRSVYNSIGEKLSERTAPLNFRKAHTFPSTDKVFDEHGNIIKNDLSASGYERSDYTYDERGNWITIKRYEVSISKKGRESRKMTQKYQRKITYRKP